jgi:hypothetical protein
VTRLGSRWHLRQGNLFRRSDRLSPDGNTRSPDLCRLHRARWQGLETPSLKVLKIDLQLMNLGSKGSAAK